MSLGAHARLAQAIALLACFASLASGADVLMTFRGDPVIPPGTYQPQMDLALGDSHTYYFNTAVTNGSTFDFEILLDVLRGDADLVVEGPISDPSGEEPRTPTLQRFSLHHTGAETIYLPRELLDEAGRGLYSATVHGFRESSSYRITLEESYSERRPPLSEQAVLEAVWEACCHSSNACFELEFAVRASGYVEPEEELDNFCHQRDQACDSEGHITSLRLAGENLECELPEQLGQLTRLQRLNLEDNFLHGSVDRLFQIFKDSPLESIRMQQNDLSSDLPCMPLDTQLATNLTYLDMSFNRIEGEWPACVLGPNIEIFTIEGNYLTGELPAELPANERLRHFDISWQEEEEGKRLGGEVPDFRAWSNLGFLGLSRNNMGGEFPLLPSTIRSLHLDDNNFNGTLPVSLAAFPDLQTLVAERNSLRGPLPADMPPAMQSVNLGDNALTGAVPSSWSVLSSLRELRLDDNNLVGPVPGWLASLPNLYALDLEDNQLTGGLEAFAAQLAAQPVNILVHFDVSGNDLDGPVPSSLARLAAFSNVEVTVRGESKDPRFDVSRNSFSGAFPADLVRAAAASPDVYFSVSENQLDCPSECIIEGNLAFTGSDAGEVLASTCMHAGSSITLAADQARLCARSQTQLAGQNTPPQVPLSPPASPSPSGPSSQSSLNDKQALLPPTTPKDGTQTLDLDNGRIPQDQAEPSSGGLSTGILIAIVAGVCIVLVAVLVSGFFAVRAYRRQTGKAYETYDGATSPRGDATNPGFPPSVPPTHAAVVDLEMAANSPADGSRAGPPVV